jgi:hypothetical protein
VRSRKHQSLRRAGAEHPIRTENLIPWSIAAFDSKQRTPEQRVEMVAKLGFSKLAFGGKPESQQAMKDEVSTPELGRKMSTWIREAGGDVKYTEYPDASHGASNYPAVREIEYFKFLMGK